MTAELIAADQASGALFAPSKESPPINLEITLKPRMAKISQSGSNPTEKLKPNSHDSTKLYDFIDTPSAVSGLVESLVRLQTNPPSLYFDLEGVNLGRNGTISILQIFVRPKQRTYLLDIHTLGIEAFYTPTKSGETLKTILESRSIPKVFFDVRNDSDALFRHFNIFLEAVQDLQVMEFATRSVPGRFVRGLARCVELDLEMTTAERENWQAMKAKGRDLFAPDRGGSYEVFNIRPLSDELCTYCVQDVEYLPQLWTEYSGRTKLLNADCSAMVKSAVNQRVLISCSDNFQGKGIHMAIGPW